MYLLHAISLPLSIGVASGLLRHMQLAQECELEPLWVPFSRVVPPLPAVPLQSGQVHKGATEPFLGRLGPYWSELPFELPLGDTNRAAPKVCATAS